MRAIHHSKYYYSLFKVPCTFSARFRLKKIYNDIKDGILLTFVGQEIRKKNKETVNKI